MCKSTLTQFFDRKQGALLVTGLCGLVAGTAVPAHGELLFQDDFQTDTAGTQPTTAELNPAIQSGDIGDRWEIRDRAEQVVQVIDNSTPGTDGNSGSNHYVSLRRTGNERSELKGFLDFTDANSDTFDDTTYNNDQIITSFRLYVPQGNAESVSAQADGSLSNSWQIRVDPNGNVSSFSDGTANDTGLDVSLDDWSDISVDLNLDESTYALTVDGQTATDLDIDGFAVDYTDTFFTERPGNPIQYYVDDVVVSNGPIPEPASAALLAVGGGLLILGRRRRA